MVKLNIKKWRADGLEAMESEVAHLKRNGFRKVSPTTELSHKEYRVIEVGDGIFDVESMVDTEADEEEGY